ncbi:MAG: helix-turn-helix transcriptional regulator [Bacteroidales bacterium]|nr:helix-turn-helix transcriptional regulator [Bacteroidales bacterium]
MIFQNRNLLLLLPRFGIPVGFGEKTIGQICNEQGVSTELFLYVCNVYCYEGFSPGSTTVTADELPTFLKYLRASHHYYIDERLPHIARHLNEVAAKAGSPYGDSLRKFFEDYRKEVEDHFAFEEEHIFPTVMKDIARSRKAFIGAHDSIEEKLSDLIQIIFKYLPENISSEEIIELTFDIFQLAEDLGKHTVLEEAVFTNGKDGERARKKTQPSEEFAGEALTEREKEVLVLVAKGYMSKEIADMLNISMNTVNTHRKNINAKTGIKSIAGLTVYALMNNLM